MQKFENHMDLNPRRSHYILIGNGNQLDKINLNRTEITSSNNQKLLGLVCSLIKQALMPIFFFIDTLSGRIYNPSVCGIPGYKKKIIIKR